jgi:hypothetical protein
VIIARLKELRSTLSCTDLIVTQRTTKPSVLFLALSTLRLSLQCEPHDVILSGLNLKNAVKDGLRYSARTVSFNKTVSLNSLRPKNATSLFPNPNRNPSTT